MIFFKKMQTNTISVLEKQIGEYRARQIEVNKENGKRFDDLNEKHKYLLTFIFHYYHFYNFFYFYRDELTKNENLHDKISSLDHQKVFKINNKSFNL